MFNDNLPDQVRSDEVLVAFAGFIRQFHDLGASYVKNLKGNEPWMLESPSNAETMCHGDLAPYNTVFRGKDIVGLIDFDTLHPGSRLWDLSYAIYRWIPLMSDDNPESFGHKDDKIRRLDLFVQSYGQDQIDRDEILPWVIRRLEYLIDFMTREATNGNEVFKTHIEAGHLDQYLTDISYIRDFERAANDRKY